MKLKQCKECAYCAYVASMDPEYGIPAELQSDCIVCSDEYCVRVSCRDARENDFMCGHNGIFFVSKQ